MTTRMPDDEAMADGRVRYAFDELNQLIIRDTHQALTPERLVEGRVRIDRQNRLRYRARRAPAAGGGSGRDDYALDGTWTLSPSHQLGVLLHPSREGEEEAVFLKGSLVDVKDDALIVSLAHRTREGEPTSQRAALSGRWQADDRNRLTFLVAKADGAEDRVVLDGAWMVDARQQLLYRYEEPQSGRRRAVVQTLRFAGRWELASSSELAYRLDATDRSSFRFRVALQSPTLNAADGRIAYQAGIQLSDGRTISRTVALFGTWKLNRDLSVSFELPDAGGRRRAFTFSGRYAWRSRHAVSVQLSRRDGQPLGIAVTFSRSWVNDKTLFLRLERMGEDARILGGVQIRF